MWYIYTCVCNINLCMCVSHSHCDVSFQEAVLRGTMTIELLYYTTLLKCYVLYIYMYMDYMYLCKLSSARERLCCILLMRAEICPGFAPSFFWLHTCDFPCIYRHIKVLLFVEVYPSMQDFLLINTYFHLSTLSSVPSSWMLFYLNVKTSSLQAWLLLPCTCTCYESKEYFIICTFDLIYKPFDLTWRWGAYYLCQLGWVHPGAA